MEIQVRPIEHQVHQYFENDFDHVGYFLMWTEDLLESKNEVPYLSAVLLYSTFALHATALKNNHFS